MSLYEDLTAGARTFLDAVDARIIALEAANATAARDLAASVAEARATATALEAARGEIEDLHESLADSQQVRADLEATIATLRARVAELEAQVPVVDAFVLGETEPTSENTGCRIPLADLVHYPGTVTGTHPVTGQPLKRGDVISGVRARQFAITVPGVTVRDVWVDGVGLDYTSGTSYHALIDARECPGGATDDDLVVYEHFTIDPATRSWRNVGVQGSNFRVYRGLIVGVTDAFSTHATGGQVPRAADILGNYAADFYIDDDLRQGDRITHNDFVQSAGKLRRLRVEGNATGGGGDTAIGKHARPRTSNILIQSNAGQHTDEGIVIRRNWLRGHPSQGSTINIPTTLSCPLVVEGNVLAADGKHPRVLVASANRTSTASTIAANVLDTGAVAPINNA